MKRYNLVFTKHAQKDAGKLGAAGLRPKAEMLLEILEHNPFQNPAPCEKLTGEMSGAYSRRVNIQHRLVHQVIEDLKSVKVIRLWTQYE